MKSSKSGAFTVPRDRINRPKTNHGRVGVPFSSLNKFAGMAQGGDVKKDMKLANLFAKAGEKKLASHERREAMGKEKDTPAIAKKEMGAMKKAKAPAGLMKYEKAEHKSMGFARGGGIESKGKTKVKRFDEGGDVEDDTDTDAEGYGTKLEGKSNAQSGTFKTAFARHRAAGDKDFTWNGKKYTTELASSKPKATANDLSEVNVTAKRVAPPPAAKPAESKSTGSSPTGAKIAANTNGFKPASSAKPTEDEVTMARARGGYPDYSNKDVRKGVSKGMQRAAEVAGTATSLAGLGRAGLRALATRGARLSTIEAPKRLVDGFSRKRLVDEAAESRKDIIDGMNKLRGEGMKSGGSVKKYARGGGIESKGKTRGRYC
jgi:hypothetical protein